MQSTISELTVAALDRARNIVGEPIQYEGVTILARSAETTGSKAGQQGVATGIWGVFIAATSPRLFVFSPTAFSDQCVPLPQQGSEFIRNGLTYLVTSTDFVNEQGITIAISCYALVKIW